MKLLPAVTRLPDTPLPRVHDPREGNYSTFRDCCRWDFGFTCALCLLHESDLIELGAEGTGLIWIEHHELKSDHEEARDEYANCLLSCRFCNNGRSSIPKTDPKTGASLLDPTVTAWSARFVLGDDLVLRPIAAGDADAERTRKLYGLDGERKAALRARRASRFSELRRAETDFVELTPELVRAARDEKKPDRKKALIRSAQAVEAAYDAWLREVSRYSLVPDDKPDACRCDHPPPHEVPAWLARQAQEITKLEAPNP